MSIFSVRIRRLLLTSEMIDISCLVYSNLCAIRNIYLKFVSICKNISINIISIKQKFECTEHEISIISVNKKRHIRTKNMLMSQGL